MNNKSMNYSYRFCWLPCAPLVYDLLDIGHKVIGIDNYIFKSNDHVNS